MDKDIPVEKLPGIGKYYSYKLKRLNIQTLRDLIYHFPFRYDDFLEVSSSRQVTPGEKASLKGILWQIKNLRTRTGKIITVATVADDSGTIEVVWFNQPYLTKTLKPGTLISLAGKVEMEGRRIKMLSPSYELLRPELSENTLHTQGLIPVYPETEGVTSKWIRTKIAKFLPLFTASVKEPLPPQIIAEEKLESLQAALKHIHFPQNDEEIKAAKERLSFDEIFSLQLMAAINKNEWNKKRKSRALKIDRLKIDDIVKRLPFILTGAQKRAVAEIISDIQKEIPANRLLEGDVGSGKTVVAALAAYVAFLNGFGTVLAAPTEILAFQHQKTLSSLLSPFGVKVGIWTKSKKITGDITCGTHALLTSFKNSKEISLVIVDEQHRFGVAQRANLFLGRKGRFTPHLLTMTATPIPRTLALTIYGDLNLSVLDEMPKGRQKIATFVVPTAKRNDAYKFIEKEIDNGRQAFIITPFVEPSESLTSVKAATEEVEKIKLKFSKNAEVGLLHGKLKSKDKEKIIGDFKTGTIHILVATPVVEVGIDVPNATIMMIESAERFGLAQLHQLRGRVGRGKYKSYCLLFSDTSNENSLKRLKSMEKIFVGFELAEIDLKMRGAGEIFGLKQSGFINLKIADIFDHKLTLRTKKQAEKLLETDPDLKKWPQTADLISSFQLVQPN